MAYENDTNFFPGLIGGQDDLNEIGRTARKGVFAEYPASTPKYSTANDDRGLESMARLMVPLPNNDAREKYLATFGGNTEASQLAKVLATIGESADGNPDPSTQYGLGYIDFLLQTAQESYQEKVQIVDVLSDNYVSYFFGAQPSVFQYTGVLMNTRQDDWRAAFTILYNDVLRGTELARRQVVATLAYDDMAVTGSLIGMTQTLTAEMQTAAQFTFSMLVQRIDVSTTLDRPATQVKTFPSFIRPDDFATTQFEVPPRTIRTADLPATQTVERKKDVSGEDAGVDQFDYTQEGQAKNDVHGAT